MVMAAVMGEIYLPFEWHMHDLTLHCSGAWHIQHIRHHMSKCVMKSSKLKLCVTGQLHLIGMVMAELDRKIWEGGLMATRCVNSPGLRRLVFIHLGFLCLLQGVRMHIRKTGWASPRLSCLLGEKAERCLWLQSCLAWGQQLHLFQSHQPPDLACGSGTLTSCFFFPPLFAWLDPYSNSHWQAKDLLKRLSIWNNLPWQMLCNKTCNQNPGGVSLCSEVST